jgi:hypothetical protein
MKMTAGIVWFDHISDRGRPDAPYKLARPVVMSLATGAAALKDASRRANTRWPRKNEAILDRGGARCLGLLRPGRENGTLPNQKTSIVVAGRRKLQRSQTARIVRSSWPVAFTACGDLLNGGRILAVFSFRVSRVGFGPSVCVLRLSCTSAIFGAPGKCVSDSSLKSGESGEHFMR